MINKIWILFLVTVTVSQIADENFFCKTKENAWTLCRRCPTIDKKCPQDPEGCHCENIQIADPEQDGKMIGGSDCNEGFCYISYESSSCDDKNDGYDEHAYTLEGVWHQGYKKGVYSDDKIVRSAAACKNQKTFDTGNKDVMDGVQIIEDYLYGVTETREGANLIVDSTPKEPLTIYADDHTECKEECQSRCGKCGAWSFYETEGLCYLHTSNACCGQQMKQTDNPKFVSGYVCPNCWSTKNLTCPCTLEERLQGPIGCSSAAFNSGAFSPHYNSPTGKLEIHVTILNEDPCQCVGKLYGRRGRKRCKCEKTQCSTDYRDDGTCGSGCCDKRRCRERKPRRERQSCSLK